MDYVHWRWFSRASILLRRHPLNSRDTTWTRGEATVRARVWRCVVYKYLAGFQFAAAFRVGRKARTSAFPTPKPLVKSAVTRSVAECAPLFLPVQNVQGDHNNGGSRFCANLLRVFVFFSFSLALSLSLSSV